MQYKSTVYNVPDMTPEKVEEILKYDPEAALLCLDTEIFQGGCAGLICKHCIFGSDEVLEVWKEKQRDEK